MVAPDSRSPNLQKPVVMWVSLLKNWKKRFLNSGNFLSQGSPWSYQRSQSSRWMVYGLKSAPISGFWWMMSRRCTSLTSGSIVLSLILVQKSIQGSTVRALKPTERSQNWQKNREREGSTKIWKGSWQRSERQQMVLSEGKTRQSTSWRQEQKGGRTAGESSGFPTLVGSKLSLRQVQQAGLHLNCHRTLQGLPVVQLTLLQRTDCNSDWPALRVDIINQILLHTHIIAGRTGAGAGAVGARGGSRGAGEGRGFNIKILIISKILI